MRSGGILTQHGQSFNWSQTSTELPGKEEIYWHNLDMRLINDPLAGRFIKAKQGSWWSGSLNIVMLDVLSFF